MEIELEGLCMDKKIDRHPHLWEDVSHGQIGDSWAIFGSSNELERDLSSFLD